MADRDWTEGLVKLDTKGTRQRLADLMAECRAVAPTLVRLEGEGLVDHVVSTENRLRLAAQVEIQRLAAVLADYRSGPLPPAPPYDAYAAARARAEAKAKAAAEDTPAPQPEPAQVPETAPVTPPRPVLPPRPGMRLPPMTLGRSA